MVSFDITEKLTSRPPNPIYMSRSRGLYPVAVFNWETGEFHFARRRDDDNGVPENEHYGHSTGFILPLSVNVQVLYDQMNASPFVENIERVSDGYSSEYDGNNDIAKFTDDAQDALDVISGYLTVDEWQHEWLASEALPILNVDHELPQHHFHFIDADEWVRSDAYLDEISNVIRFKSGPGIEIKRDTDHMDLKMLMVWQEYEGLKSGYGMIKGAVFATLLKLRDEVRSTKRR